MHKFRSEPKTLEEMRKWDMISYKIYLKVCHLPFELAKKEIEEHYGYQTYVYGIHHILEYINQYNVNVKLFTKNEWIAHCLKMAQGRMNPNVPAEVYDTIVKKEKS
ncbi:hypothetical protein ACX818_001329 [Acinetobacter baumannii]